MENLLNGWKTYALGVLMILVSATSGIAYNSAMRRIEIVETSTSKRTEIDQTNAVQLALLQKSIEELTAALDRQEIKQDKLSTRLDSMVEVMLRDSRRWNAEMDRRASEGK